MPTLDLLSLTVPIFLLIAIGAIAVRSGLVARQQIDGLSVFVMNFALPALILTALSQQDLARTFDWRYVAAYGGGSLVVFSIVFASLFATGRPVASAAMAGLGGATSNSGFIGFPVASLAFGATALTALPLNMIVENILIIPLALGLAEAGSHGGSSIGRTLVETLRRLARMPIIIAIVLGAGLSLAHIQLPEPVTVAVGMMGKASAPCALFVVGGTIVALRAAGGVAEISWIVAAKLLLHPLAVAAAFFLIGGVSPELMKAGILMASVSMITVYPIFGARFGLGEVSATALVAATGIGFATITLILGVLLR